MAIFDIFKKKKTISWFEAEDSQMQEAIQTSQETFHEFLNALEQDSYRILPALEVALIKYALPATNSIKVEHNFLSEITLDNGVLSGVISNKPIYAKEFQEGQRITIDPLRVSDWLYLIEGKSFGGLTIKLIWSRFSDEEKSQYADRPPFSWVVSH